MCMLSLSGSTARSGGRADKRLFNYPDINGEPEETIHAALSPYLFDTGGLADPRLVVCEGSHPINGMAKVDYRIETHRRGPLYSHG